MKIETIELIDNLIFWPLLGLAIVGYFVFLPLTFASIIAAIFEKIVGSIIIKRKLKKLKKDYEDGLQTVAMYGRG